MPLSRNEAVKQLADEAKFWRKNFANDNWKERPGWSSFKGNSPKDCDSIWDYDYNSVANGWCGGNSNKHKKRTEITKVIDGYSYKIFKEADRSLSGGKGTAHFIEAWSSGGQFIWHFKLEAPKTEEKEEAE